MERRRGRPPKHLTAQEDIDSQWGDKYLISKRYDGKPENGIGTYTKKMNDNPHKKHKQTGKHRDLETVEKHFNR